MKKILLLLIPVFVFANSSPLLTTIPEPDYHYPAMTSFDIQREIQPDFNNKVPSVTLDRHFVGVKYSYFEKFNKWYGEVTNGINNKQNTESFDCDNHALLYKSLFSISTLKKDVKREILVGVILVEQSNIFSEYLLPIVTH